MYEDKDDFLFQSALDYHDDNECALPFDASVNISIPSTPRLDGSSTSISQENDKEPPTGFTEVANTYILPIVVPCKKYKEEIEHQPKAKTIRIKKKIIKAKEKKQACDATLSKKQMQMIRNRIAAQESRNRKKKEIDELNSEIGRLKAENEILMQQLLHKQKCINDHYEVVNRLGPSSRTEYEAKLKEISNVPLKSRPKFKGPFLLASAILGFFCLMCFICTTTGVTFAGREYRQPISEERSVEKINLPTQECFATLDGGMIVNGSTKAITVAARIKSENAIPQVCMECNDSSTDPMTDE